MTPNPRAWYTACTAAVAGLAAAVTLSLPPEAAATAAMNGPKNEAPEVDIMRARSRVAALNPRSGGLVYPSARMPMYTLSVPVGTLLCSSMLLSVGSPRQPARPMSSCLCRSFALAAIRPTMPGPETATSK